MSKLYDMLPASTSGDPKTRTPADNQTVRNVFVIGPDKKVKLILAYPMTTGRNFDEVLRVIDSLQLTANHKVATPADWKQGDDVIIAGSVNDEQAKELFPDGWESPKPYIRIVRSPVAAAQVARTPQPRRMAERPQADVRQRTASIASDACATGASGSGRRPTRSRSTSPSPPQWRWSRCSSTSINAPTTRSSTATRTRQPSPSSSPRAPRSRGAARAPIPAVLAAVVLQAVCEWNKVNGPSWIPLLIAMYSLGAYASGRPRTVATGVVALIIGFLLLMGLRDDVIEVPETIGGAASLAVPFVVGDNVRRRRNELAELAERAERAERERELLALQRVGEERTRIARDLHDVVAHSVSAMVIQAAAARRNIDRAPDDAVDLLANIEETGRRTMSELRQILGVLRENEPATEHVGSRAAAVVHRHRVARRLGD